jgi:hypothetical protein
MWRETIKGRIWTNEVHYIQKCWTLCGTKTNMFFIYLSKADFEKGSNITTLNNLRDAKKYCNDLTKENQNA